MAPLRFQLFALEIGLKGSATEMVNSLMIFRVSQSPPYVRNTQGIKITGGWAPPTEAEFLEGRIQPLVFFKGFPDGVGTQAGLRTPKSHRHYFLHEMRKLGETPSTEKRPFQYEMNNVQLIYY